MKRSHVRLLSVAVVGSAMCGAAMFGLNAVTRADDKDATPTIKQIMKIGFAGDKKANVDSLTKVVLGGKGTHDTADQILKLCKALAASTPPRGDAEKWKTRTVELVSAAEELDKGDLPSPDAIATYKKAADCKSCHSQFRPPKKQ